MVLRSQNKSIVLIAVDNRVITPGTLHHRSAHGHLYASNSHFDLPWSDVAYPKCELLPVRTKAGLLGPAFTQ